MCVGLDTVKNTKICGHVDALTKCFNIVTHSNRMMTCVSCIKRFSPLLHLEMTQPTKMKKSSYMFWCVNNLFGLL